MVAVYMLAVSLLITAVFVISLIVSFDMFDNKPDWRRRRKLMQLFKAATESGELQWCGVVERRDYYAVAQYDKYRIKLLLERKKGRRRASYCSIWAGQRYIALVGTPSFSLYPLWDIRGLGRLVVKQLGDGDKPASLSDEELLDQCLQYFVDNKNV